MCDSTVGPPSTNNWFSHRGQKNGHVILKHNYPFLGATAISVNLTEMATLLLDGR